MSTPRTLFAALLTVVAAALVTWSVLAWRDPSAPPPERDPTRAAAERRPGFTESEAPAAAASADLEARLARLEAELAREAGERRRLTERLDTVTAELAAVRDAAAETGDAKPARAAIPNDAVHAGLTGAAASAPESGDPSVSAMERALIAAGLDAATASDIKRRGDELVMAEMHVRDLATREGWVDTPRFEAEMNAIEAQRTSVRDEIGDDAYDRYLYAQGHMNRVRVDDVLADSPAALAGLQPQDVILRYGDTRIFAPGELVAETRAGNSGEPVRLEVVRNGERLWVEVPRGPLGLRIAPSQDPPTS